MSASQFRVEKILTKNEWESQYGPMLGWRMLVKDLETGGVGPVEVNSKPEHVYNPGDTFWAEHKGEYNGAAKLKRVKPPDGSGNGQEGLSAPKTGIPVQVSSYAIPYQEALDVYKRMMEDTLDPAQAGALFSAWLDGKISTPIPF